MNNDTGARRAPLARIRPQQLAGAVLASTMLFGFGGHDVRPPGLSEIIVTRHAGDDDLLSAGLGRTGLGSATPPPIVDPASPTPAELRRLAIHANYRALIDTTPNGGYGRLYGPNIDLAGNDTLGEGLIPGTEYLAFVRNVEGVRNVTVLVQVPDSFDPARPCIVAAPSSGSRGIYGAIGTTGEWALKRGCAVGYTDKGTGAGGHELETNRVTRIDGTLADARADRKEALFAARLGEAERAAYLAAHPDRYAMKHAHSGDNPERIWGRATVHSIEFAFHVLNTAHHADPNGRHGRHRGAIRPDNTLVIAASVSNGGGASIAAAEQDRRGLIDAVVVVEPQINVEPDRRVRVMRGGEVIEGAGRTLYDYTTFANLLQPCAAIAPSNADSPVLVPIDPVRAENRCRALAGAGLVAGVDPAAQAEDARAKLVAYGWEPDSALLHASHFALSVTPAVSVTYANAFSRARVTDNLCGFSMGTTDAAGLPAPPATSPMPTLWALNNGIPPSTGINLIAEGAANGPIREALAVSASTGLADYYWDGAACLRALNDDRAVNRAIARARVRGDLDGRPTLIVHGRSDTLVPVNHTSRPYLALNSLRERGRSHLSYIEVTNAQHFEVFLALVPGYDTRLVPLHYYGGQALDLMWSHLVDGTPLPPSQVVRTVPRGGAPGAAPPLTVANVPPIAVAPAGPDVITVQRGVVHVPE